MIMQYLYEGNDPWENEIPALTLVLVSQATPLNLREKGGLVTMRTESCCRGLQNTSRTTANFAQYSYVSYIYLHVRVGIVTKKQYTKFQNLEPDWAHGFLALVQLVVRVVTRPLSP